MPTQKWYNKGMNKNKLKKCKYCNKYYSPMDFGVALTTEKKVFRRLKCKHCYLVTKRKLRQRKRKWFTDYKKRLKCSKCGIQDNRVIEFHHKNGEQKDFNLGAVITHGYALDKIKSELKKCIVICANCHRILHYEERKNKFNLKYK